MRLSLPVPSLLQQHKLLLLRLQQMDPSMNPSTTRKVREDAQPGWSPFTMPEVGRLDSCTSQWFPLGVIRHTEVIVWGWTALVEHISFPSLNLWLVPKFQECPFLNRGCCHSDPSCCGSTESDCPFHSYHNSSGGVFQSPSVCCLHSETTCKLVGSWTSLSKPQLCTKVSLSGSFLGQHHFTSNTHSPAKQRLKLPLNQDRTQWTRGCPTSPPSKRKINMTFSVFVVMLDW